MWVVRKTLGYFASTTKKTEVPTVWLGVVSFLQCYPLGLEQAVRSEDVMDYKWALQNIILNDYANSGEALSSLLATVFHGTKGVKNMDLEELEQEVCVMCSDDLEMDGVDTSDRAQMKEWVIRRAKRVPDRAADF